MTARPQDAPRRIAAVSYLNTKPLIHGLEQRPDVELVTAVPSALPAMLESGAADAALVPVIDLARKSRDWRIVSDACIGCHGATLTVRVFSRVDPADITVLHIDGDSHTSVVLASVIWREKYDRTLRLTPYDATRAPADECDAILLIGDKVIDSPPGLDLYSTQIDLGAAWRSLTDLPFVFAAWATGSRERTDELAAVLNTARNSGVAAAADIAEREGAAMGWPIALARHYLTESLSFTLTKQHREGMRTFFDLARRHELRPAAAEPVFA